MAQDAQMAKLRPPAAVMALRSPKKTPTPPRGLSRPQGQSRNIQPGKNAFHGQYISPEYPQGVQPSHDNVDIIAAIACHAKASGRKKDLSAAGLGTLFYWDYKVDTNRPASQVVNYYGERIADRLAQRNSEWKKTTLYEELLEVEVDLSKCSAEEKKRYDKVTVRGEKVVHRTPRNSSTSHNVSSNSRRSSITTTTASIDQLNITNGQAQSRPSKKRKLTPPAATELPLEKRHRDPAIISRSRPSSPSPSAQENVGPTVDSFGKPIPKRIKRCVYPSY